MGADSSLTGMPPSTTEVYIYDEYNSILWPICFILLWVLVFETGLIYIYIAQAGHELSTLLPLSAVDYRVEKPHRAKNINKK